MKNIAVIPARGGSKRLPNKNLRLLGGIPLIAHSILYAKANKDIISEIYISTDDPAIKACGIEYGVTVIDRPANISGDFEPTITAIKHVLNSISEMPDNIILLQPTNPLRPEGLLREAMKEHISQSLFTVTRSYQKLGKVNNNKFIPFNYSPGQRSQDLEPLYFENGLLYICNSQLIFDDKIISDDAVPFLSEHLYSNVDIDTAEDLEYAEYIYQNILSQKIP